MVKLRLSGLATKKGILKFLQISKWEVLTEILVWLFDNIFMLLCLTPYYYISSVTSTVTLWGKLGETFDPTLYIGESAPYVIVVSSVTVKTFQR